MNRIRFARLGWALALVLMLTSAALFRVQAHDLFLKFDSYFLVPNITAQVRLLNGTFRRSENPVARDRMVDVSVVNGAGERTHPALDDWHDEGQTALLKLQIGAAGTYVAGLYTKPRELALNAAAFNQYLAHEGVPDVLAARKQAGELTKDVRERYAKHVKAIFQVGRERTDSYKTVLGHPVEIVPQQNPYELKIGQMLTVLCLKDGQPLSNQLVLAGRETNGRVLSAPSVRTDTQGLARLRLSGAGKWYMKFIEMAAVREAEVNYESKWATLTFEVRAR